MGLKLNIWDKLAAVLLAVGGAFGLLYPITQIETYDQIPLIWYLKILFLIFAIIIAAYRIAQVKKWWGYKLTTWFLWSIVVVGIVGLVFNFTILIWFQLV